MGSATTQFVYDISGHLIAEANGSGTVQTEYVWLDDLPIGLIDATTLMPTLYFVHADHLGHPVKMTDASGSSVFSVAVDAFGNGVAASYTVFNPLQFPGQYYDSGTGFFQNWFREYDPTTGRYMQSDPIGLQGGINTYAYVSGNPLSRTDPKGEFWSEFAVIAGVLVLNYEWHKYLR